MPIVFDVADVATSDVAAATSELSEMLSLLHVIAEPAHHQDRARELRAITNGLPQQVLGQLSRLSPLWARFRLRAMTPLTMPERCESQGFEAELHAMLRLPIDAFFRMASEAIAGGRLTGGPDPLRDEPAYLELCRAKSEDREDLARQLLRDPDAFRTTLARALVLFHTAAFAAEWARIGPRISAAASTLHDRVAEGRVAELLASLAPDSHLFGQRQQVVFDKLQSAVVDGRDRQFVLVPSEWTRPHVVVKYDAAYGAVSVPIVIQFPAAAPDLHVGSLSHVQQRFLILAEASRMQISRHLVNESCTTSELATRTGMTLPQVSRHLRRLKDAGLLVSVRDGRMIKHRLRSDIVYQMGHEFLTALTR